MSEDGILPSVAVFLCTAIVLAPGCVQYEVSPEPSEVSPRPASPKRVSFTGEVTRGEDYSHSICEALTFRLVPTSHGWMISVGDPENRAEDYSMVVNPPYRGINVRDIVGWHFRNSDNSGPNSTGAKNVNAPQTVRNFCFVLDRQAYRIARAELDVLLWGVHDEERLTAARKRREGLSKGTGRLSVRELRLGNLVVGKRAWIERMRFEVEAVVPTNSATRRGKGGAAQE